jgi:hypothetical protein
MNNAVQINGEKATHSKRAGSLLGCKCSEVVSFSLFQRTILHKTKFALLHYSAVDHFYVPVLIFYILSSIIHHYKITLLSTVLESQ